MSELLEFLIFLAIGFFVGIFVYAQILLPLIYGFPKSVYLFINGGLRFLGILSQLVTPLVWIIGITLLGVLLKKFAPSINEYLINSRGFVLGQLLSILALLINFVSRRGRSDMAYDFQKTTVRFFGKPDSGVDDEKKCKLHNLEFEEFSSPYSYGYMSVASRLALRKLPENLDSFPNVENAVPKSRFEYGGKIYFRFYTCSQCRREYLSFILNDLSGYQKNTQQFSTRSSSEVPTLTEFNDSENALYQYFVGEASKVADGGIWDEELELLSVAAKNTDYSAFKVIIEEITRRPKIDVFAEPVVSTDSQENSRAQFQDHSVSSSNSPSPDLVLLQRRILESRGQIVRGTGRTIDDPFVVQAASSEDAVLTEYRKITELEGELGVDWIVSDQATAFTIEGFCDEISITTQRNGLKTYYFSVSPVFRR